MPIGLAVIALLDTKGTITDRVQSKSLQTFLKEVTKQVKYSSVLGGKEL